MEHDNSIPGSTAPQFMTLQFEQESLRNGQRNPAFQVQNDTIFLPVGFTITRPFPIRNCLVGKAETPYVLRPLQGGGRNAKNGRK